MNTYRKTAVTVGVLYIIGTVAGVLSVVFTSPILDGADVLAKVGANPGPLTIGALLVLLMGLALAMVPVLLFPIFRKINEVLAVGYVIFRGALETMTYIASVIAWLFLLIVARQYGATGALAASYFEALGSLLKEGNESFAPITGIAFSLGALMLYCILYRSKLIPRWISGWGVMAIVLHLTTCFLIVFQLQTAFSPMNMVMNFPIFLQEMVMAVWLIAKGFEPRALASTSAPAGLVSGAAQPALS